MASEGRDARRLTSRGYVAIDFLPSFFFHGFGRLVGDFSTLYFRVTILHCMFTLFVATIIHNLISEEDIAWTICHG